MSMCQGCTNEQHFLCGMQTWCECPCDGSPEWGGPDPYAAPAYCGATRLEGGGPICYQPFGHKPPHIFECDSIEDGQP